MPMGLFGCVLFIDVRSRTTHWHCSVILFSLSLFLVFLFTLILFLLQSSSTSSEFAVRGRRRGGRNFSRLCKALAARSIHKYSISTLCVVRNQFFYYILFGPHGSTLQYFLYCRSIQLHWVVREMKNCWMSLCDAEVSRITFAWHHCQEATEQQEEGAACKGRQQPAASTHALCVVHFDILSDCIRWEIFSSFVCSFVCLFEWVRVCDHPLFSRLYRSLHYSIFCRFSHEVQ